MKTLAYDPPPLLHNNAHFDCTSRDHWFKRFVRGNWSRNVKLNIQILLLRIREFGIKSWSGNRLCWSWFSSVFSSKYLDSEAYLKLGEDCFLTHPFKSVIHWSSYQSALEDLSYWWSRYVNQIRYAEWLGEIYVTFLVDLFFMLI
jgi:hypothetical protein